ncbi:MAG: SLBB domain-containing protein, partial [Bacteroidota bacterium]
MNQGIDSTRITAYGRQTASILLWIFLFLQWSLVQAQSPNNSAAAAQVRRMLSEQQIDENVLRNKLKSKGIDIDQMSPQEIMLQQNIIEETVREIQQEQSLQQVSPKGQDPNSALPDLSSAQDPMAKDYPKAMVSHSPQDNLPPSPVYGHDFFRNKSLGDFQSAQALTAPESYVLGPGDKINVLIFGRSQADLNYEINPSGFIQPNQMPKIFLTGLSLKQAREMLENKFASYYVFGNGQFTVTLQASRSVTVNVFGEVQRAGSYRLSGFHSAWAALIAAGGPTTMGSVRNIQVVRGNTRKTLDVYAFLRNPSETFDFALQNNDIVYVPVADKQVVVTGAVRRPMIYELIKTDGVKELVEMAGGLSAEASRDWAQVIRKDLREMRVLDINLSDVLNNAQKIILQDGDSIQFKAIASNLRNYVKAQGAFYHNGSYDLQATPTVQKLLAKAVLHPQAKDDIAFILRRNNDRTQQVLVADLKAIAKGLQEDMSLKSEDEVWVYEQARYASEFAIEITGEVREPFRRLFPYQEG